MTCDLIWQFKLMNVVLTLKIYSDTGDKDKYTFEANVINI